MLILTLCCGFCLEISTTSGLLMPETILMKFWKNIPNTYVSLSFFFFFFFCFYGH